MINTVIRKVNTWLSPILVESREAHSWQKKEAQIQMHQEFDSVRQITQTTATLREKILARTFTIAGQHGTKIAALRELRSTRQGIVKIVQYYKSGLFALEYLGGRREMDNTKDLFAKVQKALDISAQICETLHETETLSEKVITNVDNPIESRSRDWRIWNDYTTKMHQGRLQIEAKHATVSSLSWLNTNLLVIHLDAIPKTVYTVRILKPVQEHQRGEEIQIGDRVALVGRYMAVAEKVGQGLIMTNYLRIVIVEESGPSSGRRRNRKQNLEMPTVLIYE